MSEEKKPVDVPAANPEEESEEEDYEALRSGDPESLTRVDKINDELEQLTESGKISPEALDKALADFGEVFNADPKCVDALLGKAYVQGLMLRPDESRLTLEKALEIAPNDSRVLDMLEAIAEGAIDDDDEISPEEMQKLIDSGDVVVMGDDGVEVGVDDIGGGTDVSKLIDAKGVMTPRFREILDEIYDRFNTSEASRKAKIWTESALDAFHKAVNGTPIRPENIAFLKENFETNKKGDLTAVGFVQFYLYQTATDGKETWNDLTKLGYDADLNKAK